MKKLIVLSLMTISSASFAAREFSPTAEMAQIRREIQTQNQKNTETEKPQLSCEHEKCDDCCDKESEKC